MVKDEYGKSMWPHVALLRDVGKSERRLQDDLQYLHSMLNK